MTITEQICLKYKIFYKEHVFMLWSRQSFSSYAFFSFNAKPDCVYANTLRKYPGVFFLST